MSKNKGWLLRQVHFVPADDKSLSSVTAAANAVDQLKDLALLKKLCGRDDLILISSSAEFVSRKTKKTPAPATPAASS